MTSPITHDEWLTIWRACDRIGPEPETELCLAILSKIHEAFFGVPSNVSEAPDSQEGGGGTEVRLAKADEFVLGARRLLQRDPDDWDGPLHFAHVATYQSSMALLNYLDVGLFNADIVNAPNGSDVLVAAEAFVSAVKTYISETAAHWRRSSR